MSKLPQGWAKFNLKDLGGTQGGKTPSKSVAAYWANGTIPWTSPKDMKSFILQSSEDKISTSAIKSGGMRLLPKDTVLFVTRSGILAHTFPVALTAIETTINQDIKAVVPSEIASPKYLAYLLKSMQRQILDTCSKDGTTVASVETELLENKIFPLAPLPEQKRIADKLDAVLARVDSTRARLDRIPALLKRFRQAVLAAATSGALTEEWRDGAEAEWIETTLGACGNISGGLTKNAKRHELPLRKKYLRVANVYANRLELDDISEIGLTHAEYEKTKLVTGDLLIVEGNGSLEQLGRVAMWNGMVAECSHQNHLIRWRGHGAENKWVLFWLLSPQGRESLTRSASTTTGLHTLSISKVAAVPIALPPLEEQHEIVRRVESLFAIADRIQKQYEAAKAKIDKLAPALLAKAFRGELVPQDPNDEPASVMLARLRASKDAMVKPVKKRPQVKGQ